LSMFVCQTEVEINQMSKKRQRPRYGAVPIPVFTALQNGEINHISFAVYACIASYADTEGYAYPSRQRIANDTRLSPQAISRNVSKLIDAGLVKLTNKRGPGKKCFYMLPKHPFREEYVSKIKNGNK